MTLLDAAGQTIKTEEEKSIDLLSIRLAEDGKLGIFMPKDSPIPASGLIQVLYRVIQQLAPVAQKEMEAQGIIPATAADLKKIENTLPTPKME